MTDETLVPEQSPDHDRSAASSRISASITTLLVLILVVLILVVLILVAPALLQDPAAQNLSDALRGPFGSGGGDLQHPLGTDELGRDQLARLAFGVRASFLISISGMLLAGLAGGTLGAIAGLRGGWIDQALMRLIDVQITIPGLVMLMLIAGLLRPGYVGTALTLGFVQWVLFARVTRAEVLGLRSDEYILALRSVGVRHSRILTRHVAPALSGTLLALGVLVFAENVLLEAGLSYLGLGVPPPAATLGNMLAAGQDRLTTGSWWLVVYPGLALILLVYPLGRLGNWI